MFRGGLVWAVNVGGTAYSASDGAPHEAESSLPNGRNDSTFHFAEPEDSAPGQRVFGAFAEGRRVEEDGWNAGPCDPPFHLNPNVAVGGAWGRAGGPVDQSLFPQQMRVIYVRVFSRGPSAI